MSEIPHVYVGDDDTPTNLPWRWAICSTCRGNGKHSLHLGVYSGERLEEAQADTDFWEAYMTGQLDRRCDDCEGTGKVREVAREVTKPELLAAWDQRVEDDEYAESERRAEMRAMYGPGDSDYY